jgi:hypothetical protein
MPQDPQRIEFDVGPDKYARYTRLIGLRVGGVLVWRIVSDPVSQQDDGEKIDALRTEQLIEAGAIAAQHAPPGERPATVSQVSARLAIGELVDALPKEKRDDVLGRLRGRLTMAEWRQLGLDR